MSRTKYDCSGVIPACLLPLKDDLSIDESSYRKHLRDVTSVHGIAAITVNGHASEVSSCTFEEQQRILDITMEEVGSRLPVVNGVYAESAKDAIKIAKTAEKGGASALLIFPPNLFMLGARPDMVVDHFKQIADATDLPMIIFQFPIATGLCYPHDTLVRMLAEIPSIAAMKDACGDPVRHEFTVRELQNGPRPFNVLTTHSAWLLSSLVTGCNGLLSGAGSTIADLQVALYEAVRNNDMAAAKAASDRIYPTTHAFYSAPGVDMHNRMKEAQVMLGRLPSAAVRPPLQKLPAAEIERIRGAMIRAGLMQHDKVEAAA